MHLTVAARRLLARHPWIYWVVCLALAAGTAVLVGRQLAALDDARRELGATRAVFVSTVDHKAGDPLRVTSVDMPQALVPPSAVESVEPDAIARQRVTAGEVIVDTDLAGPVGPAALAEPGTVVVGIVDTLARNVRIGIDVEVVADGIVLAERATVVDVTDDVIFVAVDASVAPAVALAAHDAAASVLFVP